MCCKDGTSRRLRGTSLLAAAAHTVYPLLNQGYALIMDNTAPDFGHAYICLIGIHPMGGDGCACIAGHNVILETTGAFTGGNRGFADAIANVYFTPEVQEQCRVAGKT